MPPTHPCEFGIRNSEFGVSTRPPARAADPRAVVARLRASAYRPFVLVLVLVLGFSPAAAQDGSAESDPAGPELAEQEPPGEKGEPQDSVEPLKAFEWGSKGLDIRSRDGNFHAHIDWRAQLRFTSRDFDDPIAPGSSTATATS